MVKEISYVRPHRCLTRIIHSYSPGSASVSLSNIWFLYSLTNPHTLCLDYCQPTRQFLQGWRCISSMLCNGLGGNVPHNCSFPLGSGPLPNTWSPRHTQVRTLNDISIGSTVFVGFTVVTNRQTNRPRHDGNNGPHLTLRIAMRPINNSHRVQCHFSIVAVCQRPAVLCSAFSAIFRKAI